MGEAFDAACEGLQDGGQPDLVREIIAKRIIEAAKKGERGSRFGIRQRSDLGASRCSAGTKEKPRHAGVPRL